MKFLSVLCKLEEAEDYIKRKFLNTYERIRAKNEKSNESIKTNHDFKRDFFDGSSFDDSPFVCLWQYKREINRANEDRFSLTYNANRFMNGSEIGRAHV